LTLAPRAGAAGWVGQYVKILRADLFPEICGFSTTALFVQKLGVSVGKTVAFYQKAAAQRCPEPVRITSRLMSMAKVLFAQFRDLLC
jgi:hypothetical protein